jgi:hypothetical protein
MRVELLYLDGCPHYESLLPRLRDLVAEQHPNVEIELRRIESVPDAEREGFLGSPTIRIDGGDIDPAAADRHDFGLKCRLYRSGAGTSGLPPEEWIRNGLAGDRH